MSVEESYTSAGGSIPVKMFLNTKCYNMLKKGELLPVSISINLTNKCNLNCSFCSCADRDKTEELSTIDIVNFIKSNSSIQSVILTGGGEPLLYKDLEYLISFLYRKKIKIGIVTNGLLIDKYSKDIFNKVDWIRISLSDESDKVFDFFKKNIYKKNINGLGFSYVCGNNLEKNIKIVLSFYNEFENIFTHFRIINDIYILDNRVNDLKLKMLSKDKEYKKIIFQDRKNYVNGERECYISCLKPNINASGDITPCCGIQYVKDYLIKKDTFLMGNIKDKSILWIPFKGDICDKCYYDYYNKIIKSFISEIKDLEFI